MEIYHKIHAPFKRHLDGPRKGRLIIGDWSKPEFEYLASNTFEFTEKVDGTNIRIGLHQDGETLKFGGRSNNAVIPAPLLRFLEDTFSAEKFYKAGFTDSLVLFGEGYGPKIQKVGVLYRNDHSFVLFDVKIGNWWLSRKDVDDVAAKLGIESVPTVGQGTLHDAIDIVSSGITFNENGGLVYWGSGTLQSRWGPFAAEGLVCRPLVPMFDRGGQRIICKIKGVDFK